MKGYGAGEKLPGRNAMRNIAALGAVCAALSAPLAAVTVTDFEGREVTVPAPPERIVSLAPIATRILVQFNLLDRVIALDQKSFNADIVPVPISQRGYPITNLGNEKSLNEEALLRLRPGLIITQSGKAAADRLQERCGAPVVCIQNRGAMGMDYELFAVLGKALFAEDRAAAITGYMQAVIARTEAFVRENAAAVRPKVYVATDETLFNTFPKDANVTLCGGVNAAEEITALNYWGGATVDAEFLLRSKPDIIIVWIYYTRAEKAGEVWKVLGRREFAGIPAVADGRVYSALEANAGKDYFYTMVFISEMLSHLYPARYTAQMLEADVKRHLAVFYPSLPYADFQALREKTEIRK